MPNPFDFIHEIRDMNVGLNSRLDKMIEQLDIVIELLDAHNQIDAGQGLIWTEKQKEDLYGDGK